MRRRAKKKMSKVTLGRQANSRLRRHVVKLLESPEAHLGFDDAVEGFTPETRGVRPPGAAHTAWQLLEHLRICQWDILEFSRNPQYVSPAWPDGYWPSREAPPDETAWEKSAAAFRADLRAMQRLLADPRRDLLAPVNHPDAKAKHTLLREALLLADHNAYHIGQLVLLRRLLGTL